MSYSPTLGLKVVNTIQYVEESTSGTFPTNPTMNWIGVDMQYSDSADMGSIKVRNLGSEDLKYVMKGADDYEVTLDYAIQTSTFLKYLVNSQGGGSGSIDKSLSLVIEPVVNSTDEYVEILGARPDSGSIKWQVRKRTEGQRKALRSGYSSLHVQQPDRQRVFRE